VCLETPAHNLENDAKVKNANDVERERREKTTTITRLWKPIDVNLIGKAGECSPDANPMMLCARPMFGPFYVQNEIGYQDR